MNVMGFVCGCQKASILSLTDSLSHLFYTLEGRGGGVARVSILPSRTDSLAFRDLDDGKFKSTKTSSLQGKKQIQQNELKCKYYVPAYKYVLHGRTGTSDFPNPCPIEWKAYQNHDHQGLSSSNQSSSIFWFGTAGTLSVKRPAFLSSSLFFEAVQKRKFLQRTNEEVSCA